MPTVDLTARLARESKPDPKDTFLFDKSLPGFGLRIHPSGRKVWVVQARIEERSRRIVIARHGEMGLAEARRRARDPDTFLFPKNAGRQSPHNIVACWRTVCADAKLGRLRLAIDGVKWSKNGQVEIAPARGC